MSQDKQQVWPDVYPVLRSKNGSKAMEWLTQVFGFSKHMEVPGPHGRIGHAELSLGNGMIMFASGGKLVDEIVRPLADTSVRDPEGHLWSFGTYRP